MISQMIFPGPGISLIYDSSIVANYEPSSTDCSVAVVAALVEGNSTNAIVRITGAAKPTVLNLLRDLTMRMSMLSARKLKTAVTPWSFTSCITTFCRVHNSLRRTTPAMEARLTDHVWTLECLKNETASLPSRYGLSYLADKPPQSGLVPKGRSTRLRSGSAAAFSFIRAGQVIKELIVEAA